MFLYCDRANEYHSNAKEGDVYTVTGVYNENTHEELGTNYIFKTTRTHLRKEGYNDEPKTTSHYYSTSDQFDTDDEEYDDWVQWKLQQRRK